MENFRVIIFIVGSALLLFGYLRFITDEQGHVNLNNYRFTGGIGLVIIGIVKGTGDIVSRDLSKDGVSALSIYMGVLLFYIGFKL